MIKWIKSHKFWFSVIFLWLLIVSNGILIIAPQTDGDLFMYSYDTTLSLIFYVIIGLIIKAIIRKVSTRKSEVRR